MSRNPFEYVDDLSWKKENLSNEGLSGFVPWLTNRHFAKFADSILHANQVNMLHELDPQLQYDYYLVALRPRKRFARKHPADLETDELFKSIGRLMGINRRKAREVAFLLSEEQKRRVIADARSIEEEGRDVRGQAREP